MEQSDAQYRKMTETPVGPLVIRLGIPTTLSMLVTTVYNLADNYFVGKLNNTSASGAIGVVFGLMAILQAFGFMFGHGAGSIIARSLGKRDKESATRFASTGFFCCFATGIVLMTLGLCFLTPLMRLLGSSKTILPYAKEYTRYILLAAPFLTTSCVLNNILRYEGRANLAMIGLMSGGILNIFLDWLFTLKMGLGVTGAGIATGVSQTIGFLLLLTMFLRKKTESVIAARYVSKDVRDVYKICATGFPSMLREEVFPREKGIFRDADHGRSLFGCNGDSRLDFLRGPCLSVPEGSRGYQNRNEGPALFRRGASVPAAYGFCEHAVSEHRGKSDCIVSFRPAKRCHPDSGAVNFGIAARSFGNSDRAAGGGYDFVSDCAAFYGPFPQKTSAGRRACVKERVTVAFSFGICGF